MSLALGSFLLDEKGAVIDMRLCSSSEAILDAHEKLREGMQSAEEGALLAAHKDAKVCRAISSAQRESLTSALLAAGLLPKLRDADMVIAKRAIRESVKEDLLVIQAIKSIDDLDRLADLFSKRLREWYGYYLPEAVDAIKDNERFCDVILEKDKGRLLAELEVARSDSMGADFAEADIVMMLDAASSLASIFSLRHRIEAYIESRMKELCPNMLALTGPLIGARLLSHAGSLERMAGMPASTIQLLGAEKALFRHMRTKAKPPKYGLLINHPDVARSPKKGKAARVVADKISIATKVDYFKGAYVGEMLQKKMKAALPK